MDTWKWKHLIIKHLIWYFKVETAYQTCHCPSVASTQPLWHHAYHRQIPPSSSYLFFHLLTTLSDEHFSTHCSLALVSQLTSTTASSSSSSSSSALKVIKPPRTKIREPPTWGRAWRIFSFREFRWGSDSFFPARPWEFISRSCVLFLCSLVTQDWQKEIPFLVSRF